MIAIRKSIIKHIQIFCTADIKCNRNFVDAVGYYDIIFAPGITIFRIAPIGRFFFISPQTNGFFILVKYIVCDLILLAMFYSNSDPVVAKFIVADIGFVTIAAPNTMITFKYPVVNNRVAAESHLHSIGWRIGKIISQDHIVIATALSIVHRSLAGPKKKTIATVSHIVFIKQIIIALFIH